ncbi:beta-ketoacyl-[acyl-carrier-protein] synthase family protein [Sphingobacterium alkalisoli]|uniref:Beta-ketoacyl-[acyl-carrier-protein] synthase family protein n=1 Tax=Sphingobacterium alkalisoli TaxID=1874115 RepID=A0A4U0H8R3_9SPHI|nr:beta-ketoacyl-[acyl-carrier-protein] synthase family protein [Sphingobacterium alkalisoli]TJY68263.1 beta-ketoacyl-[acyl-carrier-protein] synthase family protein [Sphingobacterium alkalisoli]GGH07733.1 beta-ACP synthase [Sphingobacterium alkalisoli]
MQNGVAITGMGIVSAIGNTVAENLNSLRNAQNGITQVDNFDTSLRDKVLVGEIKLSNDQMIEKLQLPVDNSMTRTGLLGALAAKQAIVSAQIDMVSNNYRTGLVSSTSVGGMDITEKYFYAYENNPELHRYIASHDAGVSSQHIADYIGLKGFVTTISTACSSAANAIMLGAQLIKSGRLDRVIVGGTDALSKFTLNGFNTLMILSDTYCRPFDQNRKGLNLGEAAAYLILESDEIVLKENKKVLAYLSGYGNANDAFHQTASSENGEGAYLAMKKAFNLAGLSPRDIDYVNAHGTATPNNDLSEGHALIRVFGEQVPAFSSTKAYTGHTLAAAAGIEAVYSILALQNDVIFPNLNFETPMGEFQLLPQTRLLHQSVNHVLSNSFGFGGNCSTLIFSKA